MQAYFNQQSPILYLNPHQKESLIESIKLNQPKQTVLIWGGATQYKEIPLGTRSPNHSVSRHSVATPSNQCLGANKTKPPAEELEFELVLPRNSSYIVSVS